MVGLFDNSSGLLFLEKDRLSALADRPFAIDKMYVLRVVVLHVPGISAGRKGAAVQDFVAVFSAFAVPKESVSRSFW